MDKLKKYIMIGQLVAIVLLTVSLIYMCQHPRIEEKPLVTQEEYDKGNTHVKTYVSTDLSDLKKTNEGLYKLIKDIEDLESVMKIHYQYNYDSGIRESEDSNIVMVDSLYHFAEETDTVSYALDMQAKEVSWYRLRFSLNDSLMIVNRNKNNINQTLVEHSDPSSITQVEVWHPKEKKKLLDHFYLGAGIGVGYGVFNKKTDMFVGVSGGWKF